MNALQKIHVTKGDITTLTVDVMIKATTLSPVATYPDIKQVIFCMYSDPDFLLYQSEFARRIARAN
jgi:hypothetical protein